MNYEEEKQEKEMNSIQPNCYINGKPCFIYFNQENDMYEYITCYDEIIIQQNTF